MGSFLAWSVFGTGELLAEEFVFWELLFWGAFGREIFLGAYVHTP